MRKIYQFIEIERIKGDFGSIDRFVSNSDAGIGYAVGRSWPFLQSVSHTSGSLNMLSADEAKSALGTRGSISIQLADSHSSDFFTEPNASVAQGGTFFARYLARNRYLVGRRMRWVTGHIGGDQRLINTASRDYVIESVQLNNSSLSITATDPITSIVTKGLQLPREGAAQSMGDIKDNSTSIVLADLGSIEEFASHYTMGVETYIAVDSEVIRVSVNASASTLEILERGALGTEIDDHKDGSRIQMVTELGGTPDKIISFLLGMGEVGAWVDHANLESIADKAIWLSQDYHAYISRPEKIEKLLSDICEQTLCSVFYNDRENKIQLSASIPLASDVHQAPHINDDVIIKDSLQITSQTESITTRVAAFSQVRSWSGAVTSSDNYENVVVTVAANEEHDDRLGYHKQKTMYMYFCTNEQAHENAMHLLSTLMRPITQIRLSLDYESGKDMRVGDWVTLGSHSLVDGSGSPRAIIGQISSLDEVKAAHAYGLTICSYDTQPIEVPDGEYIINIPTLVEDLDLRDLFDRLYSNRITLKSGDKVVFNFGANVVIGQYAANQALTTGTWPDGVELVCQSLQGSTLIVGRRGKGGRGCGGPATKKGALGYSLSQPPEAGGNGGNGIVMWHPVKFVGEFAFGGGGGGGGGGGAALYWYKARFFDYDTWCQSGGGGCAGGGYARPEEDLSGAPGNERLTSMSPQGPSPYLIAGIYGTQSPYHQLVNGMTREGRITGGSNPYPPRYHGGSSGAIVGVQIAAGLGGDSGAIGSDGGHGRKGRVYVSASSVNVSQHREIEVDGAEGGLTGLATNGFYSFADTTDADVIFFGVIA